MARGSMTGMAWYADEQRALVDLDAVVVDGVATVDVFRFEMSGGGLIRTRWARADSEVHPIALAVAKREAQTSAIPAERETIPASPSSQGGEPSAPSGDPRPAVPHPHDDEFDGKATVAWVSTPVAPAAYDVGVTRKDSLTIVGNSSSTFVGRMRPLGSIFPVTVTTRLNATTSHANHQRGGGLLVSTAGLAPADAVDYFGLVFNGGKYVFQHLRYTLAGAYVTFNDFGLPNGLPLWLRAEFESATRLAFSFSFDGALWVPGFVVDLPAPAGSVGVGVANEGNIPGGVSASFEYVRSTHPAVVDE